MNHNLLKLIPVWLIFIWLPFDRATAQPLDDIGLEYQSKGLVATIRLTGPVHYLRHFPETKGKLLEIFYEPMPGVPGSDAWVDNEVRQAPRSGLIPNFTVTTRDQQTKPRLVVEFAREVEYSVVPGKDNRSILITIRPDKIKVSNVPLPLLPAIKPEPPAAANLVPGSDEANVADANRQAHALMVQGRDALDAGNHEAAVDAFNKLLLLIPNAYSQDSQEWVGVARERAGQIDKAKIEYELYLKLYPEGEDASRVAQRLAALAGQGVKPKLAGSGQETTQRAPRKMTFGSVSSRYYYAATKSKTTSAFNNADTQWNRQIDRLLITSLDASQRYLSEEYDGRLVFRDTNTRNFIANQPSRNRIGAAYGEIKNRKLDYSLRLGRQSATGGGVQGRFDGVAGSYGDAQVMRFNGVTGALMDYSEGGTKPYFVGASIDKGPYSLYTINQRTEGQLDRRAVGAEWRYFEERKTGFATLDYDTYFKALNVAQVMGSFGYSGAMVHFLVDRRKAPTLSIRNALYGASTSSINALNLTSSELRQLALARTASSTMGQVGFTIPLHEKWQVGTDFRISTITGLPASGAASTPQNHLDATPGRGTEKSVTGQVIGSNLYRDKDIWSGSVTLNTSSAVNGISLNGFNHNSFSSGWTMDTTLQLSRQKDQYGGTTTITSPMVRGAYRLREQLYADMDGGVELIKFNGAQFTKTTRLFCSAGLRWDF